LGKTPVANPGAWPARPPNSFSISLSAPANHAIVACRVKSIIVAMRSFRFYGVQHPQVSHRLKTTRIAMRISGQRNLAPKRSDSPQRKAQANQRANPVVSDSRTPGHSSTMRCPLWPLDSGARRRTAKAPLRPPPPPRAQKPARLTLIWQRSEPALGQVLARFAREQEALVLMLTVRDAVHERVRGFELGADDLPGEAIRVFRTPGPRALPAAPLNASPAGDRSHGRS